MLKVGRHQKLPVGADLEVPGVDETGNKLPEMLFFIALGVVGPTLF
jgi:hypothetical protein